MRIEIHVNRQQPSGDSAAGRQHIGTDRHLPANKGHSAQVLERGRLIGQMGLQIDDRPVPDHGQQLPRLKLLQPQLPRRARLSPGQPTGIASTHDTTGTDRTEHRAGTPDKHELGSHLKMTTAPPIAWGTPIAMTPY